MLDVLCLENPQGHLGTRSKTDLGSELGWGEDMHPLGEGHEHSRRGTVQQEEMISAQ
jgi:hypothetical protein